jgi:hypothetical protein
MSTHTKLSRRVLILLIIKALIARCEAGTAAFAQPAQLLGQMIENAIQFDDGFTLDIFSPENRTVTVLQNSNPLAVQYISGTTGGQYTALTAYSYQVQTGGQSTPATDLIAQLSLPYDPNALSMFGVDPSNTFVGKLSTDGSSWVVVDSQTAVNM